MVSIHIHVLSWLVVVVGGDGFWFNVLSAIF